MKKIFKMLAMSTLVLSQACSAVIPSNEAILQAIPTATSSQEKITEPTQENRAEVSTHGPVLLFGIGMHIEPIGSTPSELVGGGKSSNRSPSTPPPGGQGRPSYQDTAFFEHSVGDIMSVAEIVERHGGSMTVQAQTPFTQIAIDQGNPALSDLAAAGHEIALHFHEDAHLGKGSERLPVETWCAVMQEEIALVKTASGVEQVRYWSGGNLYPDLFDAAACAGLDVNSDWKNPQTQSTPLELTGLHPWRPAAGTDGVDMSLITSHDPGGAVIFLPEGLYKREDFASMRRSAGGEEAYFQFLADSLHESLAAAEAGKVNVFHFTVHPGEFRGDPAQPFQVIERFLAQVVDPLVASGQVRWATFSQMADAYIAWEQGQSAAEVQAPPVAAASSQPGSTNPENGYISFIINVHDWVYSDESADTLLALVDLFEKYAVRGDFYFTAPVVEAYQNNRPDVIERLRDSEMTISYHIRAPHPLTSGFEERLQGLSDQELAQALLDYETFALDLETGNLDRSRAGGYTYVASVFGRNPVVASAPINDPRLKQAGLQVYASLGAQMTVMYHEEGTQIEQPYESIAGLLVRPSDFSVTRTMTVNGTQDFWWNYMTAPDAANYQPLTLLQAGLVGWQAAGYDRPPFITSLIHENNFYRRGPEAWTSFYYQVQGNKKGQPLSPPFDLSAPDASRPRSPAEQQAIWQAYEAMVAWSAENLQVVTSEDIIGMAGGELKN